MNKRRQMKRRGWRSGAVLAAGFVLGIAASCDGSPEDNYNEEVMDLALQIHERCDERVGDNENTPTAFSIYKREDLDACAETCRFRAQAARKCIRRLKRMVDSCDAVSLMVCERVYVDCGPGFDHDRCDMGRCAVSTQRDAAGGLLALGLLMLGGWARRRRA